MNENKVDLEKLLHYCCDMLQNEKHLTQEQVYEKAQAYVDSFDPENSVVAKGSLEALIAEGIRPLAI
jgi:hypothetical protein